MAAVERDSLRWAGKNTSGEAIAAGRNNKGRGKKLSRAKRETPADTSFHRRIGARDKKLVEGGEAGL